MVGAYSAKSLTTTFPMGLICYFLSLFPRQSGITHQNSSPLMPMPGFGCVVVAFPQRS